MNIVHVVPKLIKGGGERVAAILANEAVKYGHAVTMLAASPADAAQLQDSLHHEVKVKFVSGAQGSRVSRYVSLPRWLLRERAWLSQQDVVHCHLTYGSVFGTAVQLVRAVSSAPGPAVVETYHAVGMPISRLKRWAHSRLAAWRDALALMGSDDYWEAYLRQRPALLAKIIPNGVADPLVSKVDADARAAYRRALGIPDECRFVIGTVGMLRADRKPDVYVPIFAQIARMLGRDVHFVIAGAGPELEHIQAQITDYGLQQRVHLPGLVLEPRLPLSIMDLYLTVNVSQVAGLAAMEAALAGLPLLAVQLQPAYRAQPTDWIWSSADLHEVAARTVELLMSPEAREQLAASQRGYVQAHHSVDAMVHSYAALYEAAIIRASSRATPPDNALHR